MNVFLVEDSNDIRARIKTTVEDAGAHVIGEAATEAAAIAGMQATCPEVAIIDLSLAEGSGIGVLRAVKPVMPDTILVVLTDHRRRFYETVCMASGADYFLEKTGDYPRFETLMEELVAEHDFNVQRNRV